MAFKITSFEIVGNCMQIITGSGGAKSPGWTKPPVLLPPSFAGLTAVEKDPLYLDASMIAEIRDKLMVTILNESEIANAKLAAKDVCAVEMNNKASQALILVGEDAGYKPLGGGIHSIGFWIFQTATKAYEIPHSRDYAGTTYDFVIYPLAMMQIEEI